MINLIGRRVVQYVKGLTHGFLSWLTLLVVGLYIMLKV